MVTLVFRLILVEGRDQVELQNVSFITGDMFKLEMRKWQRNNRITSVAGPEYGRPDLIASHRFSVSNRLSVVTSAMNPMVKKSPMREVAAEM